MTNQTDTERAAFEAMMRRDFHSFPLRRMADIKGRDGDYISAGTQHMWNGFKAARASLAQAPAEAPTNDVREALKHLHELKTDHHVAVQRIEKLLAASPAPAPEAPTHEPCPNAAHMGEHACTNRHQCWEPCGELGHSAEHAVVYRPQAQAEAPKDEPVAPTWGREEIDAVADRLGDDAALLRGEYGEDERADNMDRAASMLTVFAMLTRPTVQAQLTDGAKGPEHG